MIPTLAAQVSGSEPSWAHVPGVAGPWRLTVDRFLELVKGGFFTEKDPAQFVREADHFARCVFDNKEPKSNGEEGLRDMRYMAEIYRSCGLTMGS